VDAIDFEETRTHWHTGRPILKGAPGDDVLWGPQKTLALQDALGRWLEDHPDGPLLISHRTGRRKGFAGTPRRFDSIWVSDDFAVINVSYLYVDALAAGSGQAAVVADLELRSPAGQDRVRAIKRVAHVSPRTPRSKGKRIDLPATSLLRRRG
jgi:hypothetical protein